MGAKTWMLVYADGDVRDLLAAKPKLDRDATIRLARALFPNDGLQAIDDGNLADTSPPDDEITIGCFPGVSVVAAAEFGLDYPSRLPPRFLRPAPGRTVYLHAMHSAVDWFAFAIWQDGQLKRALSLSPAREPCTLSQEPAHIESPALARNPRRSALRLRQRRALRRTRSATSSRPSMAVLAKSPCLVHAQSASTGLSSGA